MGSPRLKGTTLSMLVDGIDRWADCTSVVLDGLDREVFGICGVARVLRERWWLDVEAVQSTHRDSLWTFLYEHHDQQVPFAYAPHGNAVPTGDEPHFTGILTVPAPPRLGGRAGRTVEQTFTTRLHIIGEPVRVTTT